MPGAGSAAWASRSQHSPPGWALTLVVALAALYLLDLEVVDRSDAEQVTVPQVVGMEVAEAERAIADVGLSPEVFKTPDSGGSESDPPSLDWGGPSDDKVIGQTPTAGDQVDEGTVVGLESVNQ